jgi:hypothetical protein
MNMCCSRCHHRLSRRDLLSGTGYKSTKKASISTLPVGTPTLRHGDVVRRTFISTSAMVGLGE